MKEKLKYILFAIFRNIPTTVAWYLLLDFVSENNKSNILILSLIVIVRVVSDADSDRQEDKRISYIENK